MPRNGSGTYSLPAGNPVTSGTLIEASWANTTLSDLASAMTDSLSRNGEGGMTAPLRFADGTVSAPGVAWTNETSTGFYRHNTGDMRVSLQGVDVSIWNSTGLTIPAAKALTALGNATVGGTLGVTGVLTATAGVSGNATTATTLQTARTINGVSFNGSANISVNTVNSLTINNGGAGAASGSTFNGGAALTVSYNTVGAPSTTGTGASGTWPIGISGNAATVTNGVYTTGAQTIAGSKTFSSDLNVAGSVFRTQAAGTGYLVYGSNGSTNNGVYYDQANSEISIWTVSGKRFHINSSGNAVFGGTITIGSSELSPAGSTPSYTARAWANFNGTGTLLVRDSKNVSSVVDFGIGDYVINFATNMPTTNYSMTGTCNARVNHPVRGVSLIEGGGLSVSNVRVTTGCSGGSGIAGIQEDCEYVFLAFFY